MAFSIEQFRSWLSTALRGRLDERGAAAVEYALLLVFIALVLIIAVTALGNTTSGGLDDAGSSGFAGP